MNTATPAVNPLTQLWDDILAEGAKVVTEAKALAVTLETEAVAAFEDICRVGAPLAVAAVLAEVPKIATGEEKFGNAVTSVAEDLQKQLGPVAIADVQTLIQTTVRGLQTIASGQ
jgi:hypothetical protein